MLALMPADSSKAVLEFVAGTGLLNFLLKDHYSVIILMDISQEMILKIREKITAQGASHMVFHYPYTGVLIRTGWTGS